MILLAGQPVHVDNTQSSQPSSSVGRQNLEVQGQVEGFVQSEDWKKMKRERGKKKTWSQLILHYSAFFWITVVDGTVQSREEFVEYKMGKEIKKEDNTTKENFSNRKKEPVP